MTAYYNEIDPYAAQCLRNLINAGHIAPGIVDERSIEDVFPSDLRGFTQCHFFAGIGVWSYALRTAGWGDDRPVWTGSCPCQPFSTAGQGTGFDDERHLWPAFHHLIKECRPPEVLGEQVASKDADPWLDLVSADLEELGFAFGAIAFPSAGVGAPHIRDRTYWVAHADSSTRREGRPDVGGRVDGSHAQPRPRPGGGNVSGLLGNAGNAGNEGLPQRLRFPGISGCASGTDAGQAAERAGIHAPGWMADDSGIGRDRRQGIPAGREHGWAHAGRDQSDDGLVGVGEVGHVARPAGPANGFWGVADWLLCRDGKWRPVEPGTFPLVDGPAARLGSLRADWHTPAGPEGFGHRAGRLKGYGNAINAEAAIAFIQCLKD